MLIWYFGFIIFTLVNVSHTSTILNLSVTKLYWHVLYYLISKNLYSLQNAQPFIFQFICMQLCKCLNYFLKAHNKQLNQYCLNFIIFLTKKKVLKNGSSHRLGWVGPQKKGWVGLQKKGWVTGQPVFASCRKNRVQVGYFLG